MTRLAHGGRHRAVRATVLALLVLSLGLRFAFPSGTMPGAGQWITLCTLDGPVSLLRGADGELHEDDGHGAVDCPFFLIAGGALAAPDASPQWPPAAAHRLRPHVLPVGDVGAGLALPPPRGPPAIA